MKPAKRILKNDRLGFFELAHREETRRVCFCGGADTASSEVPEKIRRGKPNAGDVSWLIEFKEIYGGHQRDE